MSLLARRIGDAPLIHPGMDGRMGSNINGPSLIAAPTWVARPLARYYLYFADHRGRYIRLALADRVEGPWRMHAPGCLDVAQSLFCAKRPSAPGPAPAGVEPGEDWLYPHLASPDVHVDPVERRVRMYCHGLLPDGSQATRLAVSSDGLDFEVRPEVLGPSYFRAFRHGAWTYAHVFRNRLYRSADGLGGFQAGPVPFDPATRHAALLVRGDLAHVFWTRIGEAPERILHATMALGGDWNDWQLSAPEELLRPERAWEGAGLPLEASLRGAVDAPVNQLRDPCPFEADGRLWLLYVIAGESGIALAELEGV